MKNIETERLIFAHYDEDMYEDFIHLFTDEDVMKYVDKGVLSRDAADALWHRLTREFYPRGIKTIWAVLARENGRFIANASIRPRPEKKDETEIGYMLMQAEWGKGYATEIARRLIKLGFDELHLKTVYATVDVENESSIKVLEKCGMEIIRVEYDELGKFYVYGVRK
jgi:ribosomal-protein-alanine N-acetyltransferase